jgi:hypothetical protein
MKNWKTVPIPGKMQGLERDARGFTIPFIVLRDNNNKAHFQINDTYKVLECIKNRLCAICGNPLKDDMWLAGGPLSAFHPNGAYIDTPTHHECGTYALIICPYLAVSAYNKRLDSTTLNTDNFEGSIFIDPTVIADRPPFFVFAKISDFTVNPENMYLIPVKPFLEVEFWKEGLIIPQIEAQELFDIKYNNKPAA